MEDERDEHIASTSLVVNAEFIAAAPDAIERLLATVAMLTDIGHMQSQLLGAMYKLNTTRDLGGKLAGWQSSIRNNPPPSDNEKP